MITTTEQLEEILSRPSQHDVEALGRLDGNLLILGAAGKMGPSLATRAKRAFDQASLANHVIAVSRFGDAAARKSLEDAGIQTISADLMDRAALQRLPDAPYVIFMAGRKFGTQGAQHETWAANVLLPSMAAERYRDSRIVVFSSGNVYPFRKLKEGGAWEEIETDPVGEYAQTVRGRERMFEYFAEHFGTRSVLLRLNYAVEMRYGVLADIARKVYDGQPVDVSMGSVNVIWQGDANSVALRSFPLCSAPPAVLNLTGPETLSVRLLAKSFGRLFGMDPVFQGTEGETALLNDAHKCYDMFGPPSVGVAQVIEWLAAWIQRGGASLGKPTHFEATDGRY